MQNAQHPLTQEILDFWFAGIDAHGNVPDAQQQKWWQKNAVFDAEITARFAEHHSKAAAGDYDELLITSQGRLALIILLDQFSRQMFRDSADMFAVDHIALNWCQQGLQQHAELTLLPIEQVFFCMPLEHAEDLAIQCISVECYTHLLEQVSENQ